MRFIKLDKRAKRVKMGGKGIIIFLVFVLLFFVTGAVEAGKVKDIRKRVHTRSSVFIPPSRQAKVQRVRNSIFFSPLETVIADGPPHNSLVQNTRVEFTLDGWQIVPFEKASRFDVWLIGFDGGWREVASRVSYNLPPGRRTYTLLARAKNNGDEFDNTAAVRTFTVNVSPYFGKVKIGNVSWRGDFSRPHYEKLSLHNAGAEPSVRVSGWWVAVKRNNFSFPVPAAAAILDPRNSLAYDPIVLKRNDTVDIYVGKGSPVGLNFQENSCTGYLRDSFEGYDALSGFGSCPVPDSSSYNHFGVKCREFVRGLSSCSVPRLEYYSFINEPSCRDFIVRNYNYQACVARARSQAGFYAGRWKVYLGRSEEVLDDLNDTVYLYDAQGLLVDVYKY